MGFRAAICPTCGKNVQVPDDLAVAACMYCSAPINLKNQTASNSPKVSISNLLGMAKTAELAGNNEEAHGYFNRVLEIDPRLSEAWLGKGKAAGWQSTMANIRLPETIVAFGHAIATADPNRKQAVTKQSMDEVNRIVTAIYSISRNHMLEFVALDRTWPDYLNQVAQLLEGLDGALGWAPNDVTTLENVVHLCKDNIEGVTYRDQFNQNAPGSAHLSPEYETLLKGKLTAAADRLKQIDPTYQPPTIEKKQADACFVVTATMGDFNHPTVSLLRKFRDRHLMTNRWGRSFVQRYYVFGPIAANAIESSNLRKRISFAVIVKPAELLAKTIMRFDRRELP